MACDDEPILRVGDFGGILERAIKARNADGRLVAYELDDAADSVVFRFLRPDGTVVDEDATIYDEERGLARYVIEAGLLTVPGTYEWQAIVTTPLAEFASNVATFEVEARLPAPA